MRVTAHGELKACIRHPSSRNKGTLADCGNARRVGQHYAVNAVAALMRDASKSATYKSALLKALIRIAVGGEALHIPLSRIGEEFVRLYWDQTVIYHLRQAAVLSKEAIVVKLIRETALSHKARAMNDLPATDRAELVTRMAKLLTVNVLKAFHTSKPASMSALYSWGQSDLAITLSQESHTFLRANRLPLEVIANYHWADYLEACNRLAPRIIQKVSRESARRSSLARYMALLKRDDDAQCFYCRLPASAGIPMAVDHVIPWSFLLEDPLWDLVIACQPCNSKKSDWLPAPEYLEKLKRRNFDSKIFSGNVSLLVAEPDIERFYNAAISVEWPGFWTPE